MTLVANNQTGPALIGTTARRVSVVMVAKDAVQTAPALVATRIVADPLARPVTGPVSIGIAVRGMTLLVPPTVVLIAGNGPTAAHGTTPPVLTGSDPAPKIAGLMTDRASTATTAPATANRPALPISTEMMSIVATNVVEMTTGATTVVIVIPAVTTAPVMTTGVVVTVIATPASPVHHGFRGMTNPPDALTNPILNGVSVGMPVTINPVLAMITGATAVIMTVRPTPASRVSSAKIPVTGAWETTKKRPTTTLKKPVFADCRTEPAPAAPAQLAAVATTGASMHGPNAGPTGRAMSVRTARAGMSALPQHPAWMTEPPA